MSKRGVCSIGLWNPKNYLNVGSVLRAASCYDADLIAIQGRRFKVAATDTTKGFLHKPLIETDDLFEVIPYGSVPVAIEFISSARSLPTYTHPPRAFYIFGPEDSSLSKSVLDRCRDVVYVPTEYCMNLAATVNVLLYDRATKLNGFKQAA